MIKADTTLASTRAWRRFGVILIVLCVLFAGLPSVLAIVVFVRSGEYLQGTDLFELQRQRGGLYQTALSDDTYAIHTKMARYAAIKPDVVALGSSRVLQFRQRSFTRPFSNFGTSLSTLLLLSVSQAMVLVHPPKMVLLGIDFWWFNEVRYTRNDYFIPTGPQIAAGWPNEVRRTPFEPGVLDTGYRFLREVNRQLRRIPLMARFLAPEYLPVFASLTTGFDVWGAPAVYRANVGVAGLLSGAGVDLQGSYHYSWAFKPGNERPGFAPKLDRIERRAEGFEVAPGVSNHHWRQLTLSIDVLRQAGAQVIVFLPPFPGPIVRRMEETGDYGIIDDLRERLAALDVPTFDFHDPATIGSGDCEFADGMHGGEVTYLRMLRAMTLSPDSGLAEFVDLPAVETLIDRFAGHAQAYETSPWMGNGAQEVDFLQLGCKKI